MPHTDIENINAYGVLKISPLFILVLLFMMRHYWLTMAALTSRSPQVMAMSIDGAMLKFQLAAEAPALLVALVAILRKPHKRMWPAVIWRFSPALLSISALCSAALTIHSASTLSMVSDLQWITIFALAGCVVYCHLPRVRAMFREFPAPPREAD